MSQETPRQAPAGAAASAGGEADGSPLNPGVAKREVWAWAMYDFATLATPP